MTENIVNKVHKSLLKNKKSLAAAESCTGGLSSSLLTRLPGSSRYFILGVVTYSNAAKTAILKIPAATIKKYGAVSAEVASLMAQNVRKIAKANLGIGITGIAGPSGGSPQKPVGTVFIAVENDAKKICRKFRFSGNRENVRKQAALKSLELLSCLVSNDKIQISK